MVGTTARLSPQSRLRCNKLPLSWPRAASELRSRQHTHGGDRAVRRGHPVVSTGSSAEGAETRWTWVSWMTAAGACSAIRRGSGSRGSSSALWAWGSSAGPCRPDLQLHRPLGGEADDLARQVGVRGSFEQVLKAIMPSAILASSFGSVGPSNFNLDRRRVAMAALRTAGGHGPLERPIAALCAPVGIPLRFRIAVSGRTEQPIERD